MSDPVDRTEVARAFAQHRFDQAIPHLAHDVRWTILGYLVLEGADAVARTCRDTAGSLAGTTAEWERCRTVAEGDTVVVEARGDNVTKAGLRYDNQYCMVWRIENGKIKLIKEYCDSALVERVLGPFPQERKRAAG